MAKEELTMARLRWVLVCVMMCASPVAFAHGVSESDKAAMVEGSALEYIWLGAEHMVTGYDHLLFLFGVLFFYRASAISCVLLVHLRWAIASHYWVPHWRA